MASDVNRATAEGMEDTASVGDKVSTVHRALDVLSLFARSDASTLGVTEIADTLGLSKAVVHRLLTTFRGRGFVEVDASTRRYRLGPGMLTLGLAYLDRVDVRVLGHETLASLVEATNETATLSVRVGWSRVYIDQVTPKRDVKMVVELGRSFPLHAGASSKALLAYLPREDQEAYLNNHDLIALTPTTRTKPAQLRTEINGIRKAGFAVSFGERDAGAGAVAAPVFGVDEAPVGVISVAGPLERFKPESQRCARVLAAAVDDLSRRLGHRALS